MGDSGQVSFARIDHVSKVPVAVDTARSVGRHCISLCVTVSSASRQRQLFTIAKCVAVRIPGLCAALKYRPGLHTALSDASRPDGHWAFGRIYGREFR